MSRDSLPLTRSELEEWDSAGLSPGYVPTNWLTLPMDKMLADMLRGLRKSLELRQ